jgi:hypothetical protein
VADRGAQNEEGDDGCRSFITTASPGARAVLRQHDCLSAGALGIRRIDGDFKPMHYPRPFAIRIARPIKLS